MSGLRMTVWVVVVWVLLTYAGGVAADQRVLVGSRVYLSLDAGFGGHADLTGPAVGGELGLAFGHLRLVGSGRGILADQGMGMLSGGLRLYLDISGQLFARQARRWWVTPFIGGGVESVWTNGNYDMVGGSYVGGVVAAGLSVPIWQGRRQALELAPRVEWVIDSEARSGVIGVLGLRWWL